MSDMNVNPFVPQNLVGDTPKPAPKPQAAAAASQPTSDTSVNPWVPQSLVSDPPKLASKQSAPPPEAAAPAPAKRRVAAAASQPTLKRSASAREAAGSAPAKRRVAAETSQPTRKRSAPALEAAAPAPENPLAAPQDASRWVATGPAPRPRIITGSGFKNQVALTFDDGPNPVNTPKVLDILKREGIKATFFVCGNNVEKYPELVRRIVAEGHTLGNHTWDHANLKTLNRTKIDRELDSTQAAVDKALGYHYELSQTRPPYGNRNSTVDQTINSNGDAVVLWNVDSNDWKYPHNDQAILNNVFGHFNGGIVLFHDIHAQGPRVLPEVIDRMQRQGMTFVTTDQMLQKTWPQGGGNV